MASEPDNGRPPPPFGWKVFTAVWLVFPAGFVFQVLGRGLSPVETLAFLASMAALVSIFVWLMLRYPFPAGEIRDLSVRLGLLLVLAALAFYVEVAYGGGVPWRFMYVVVAGAVILPTWRAAGAVLSATLFAGMFFVVRSGWEAVAADWGYLVPFALIGVGMIAASRLVMTVRELEAARKEIARLAVSEERLRFARDLHDLLGHSLSLITLKSELAGRLLPANPSKAAAEVRDIESIARRSLGEVREAVAGYRESTLNEELGNARETLEAAGIEARIEDETDALPNGVDSVLAWTVREGATNVVRHSRAENCRISLTRRGASIHAVISDDGDGSEGDGAGSGLRGLAERVEANGGEFEAGPMPEGGFRLRVRLPLRSGGNTPVEPESKAGERRGGARR